MDTGQNDGTNKELDGQ